MADHITDDLRLDCGATERFWANVDKTPWGCWWWTGRTDSDGYGIFNLRDKARKAHRVAYATVNSVPYPDGVIDHVCRVRKCVNPEHMDVVTPRENFLRGSNVMSVHARKTHCVNGHEFTPENIYWNERGRTCKTCALARSKRLKTCSYCSKQIPSASLRRHIRRYHEEDTRAL